ncbi:MAG: UbiA family prenyltransferase [Anaerolineae bacterium]|nr:UbiA family prenyltransferase [Anaerolineae bacterium]
MVRKIRDFLELVKFEHTLFALPFAYLGMILAAAKDGSHPLTWRHAFWITLAMAAARTLAMGANRLADRAFDAQNPRTANRPLVTGRIKPATAWIGTFLAGLVLTVAAWQLGPLPLKLLPGAVIFLVGYSFTKRFTWLSHFILGFTDGLAPAGAWIAVRGSVFTTSDAPAWLLLGAVTLWIAGFDILYACQDAEFDRQANLYAIPARFGVATALRISTICHGLTLLCLAALGVAVPLGWPYGVGIVVVSGLLIYEHLLVHPNNLDHIQIAFFNINSYISLTLLGSVLVAIYLA